MTQEREDYMRRQEAEHDMIRMRDPAKSVLSRQHGLTIGMQSGRHWQDKSGCQYCDGYCHGGCRS